MERHAHELNTRPPATFRRAEYSLIAMKATDAAGTPQKTHAKAGALKSRVENFVIHDAIADAIIAFDAPEAAVVVVFSHSASPRYFRTEYDGVIRYLREILR